MKIVGWNVNGIRAVHRKEELAPFIEKHDPDIVCMQETKARGEQLGKINEAFPDYIKYYHAAEKAGYSGVAIWVHERIGEHEVSTGMPDYDDNEGRVIRLDFKHYTVFNVYFPNGGKSQEAWEDKLVFYDRFLKYINELRKIGRDVLFTGDVNCAHEEIDIARPKDNDGKVGFHPSERAWVDRVINDGWVDSWRRRNPEEVKYSWWHLRSGARARNVGWRIDYVFTDEKNDTLISEIDYDNDQMGSDHCPIIFDIGWE